MTEAVRRRIVVGIDTSAESRRALEWAVSFAVPGDIVELVHVWALDVGSGAVTGHRLGSAADSSALQAAATTLLYDTADEVLEDEDRELLDLRFTVVHGHAADVLVERAAGADLLVVGRRGLGGYRALLAGSVSDDLVQLAPCPVAVMPP